MEFQWHMIEKDFFIGLANEKKDFVSLSTPRLLKKKQMIFQEGEIGGSAFYLDEGRIRIFRESFIGKEAIVFIRNRGEIFGLAELLGEQKRVFNAQAISSCRLYEIRKKDFEMLLQRHFPLAKRVIEILGRRVRYLGKQLESLIVCDVATRLLGLLTCLCCQGVPDAKILDEPILIPVKLTQEQIAAMIGSTQQTVSETLKKLKKVGLIEVSGKGITILKPREIFERTMI